MLTQPMKSDDDDDDDVSGSSYFSSPVKHNIPITPTFV